MQRTALALLFSLTLTCPGLRAQEDMAMPGPPEQLAKFDRMIGNWEGKGTASMGPGQSEMPWTSTSTIRKVMNGFFIQEDTVIEIGQGMPPMVFRSFYGYDTQNEKYMSCATGNNGKVSASEIHWTDDDTMVTVETAMEEDQLAVDRWVTRLEKDRCTFHGNRALGDGDFFVYVKGEMKRTDKDLEAKPLEAAASFAETSEEMKRLNKMAGNYSLKGSYTHAPGADPMQITGSESLVPIFGGTVLMARTKGQPMNYEAWTAFSWNAEKKCYNQVFVSNMGEIGVTEARWVGDKLVSTHSGQYMGQPSVSRGIITVGENGAVRSACAHSIFGTNDPMKVFEATYTKN